MKKLLIVSIVVGMLIGAGGCNYVPTEESYGMGISHILNDSAPIQVDNDNR